MQRVKPDTVANISQDFAEKELEINQRESLAKSLGVLLNAIDSVSKDLPLESEPADFLAVLEELSHERIK